MFTLTGGTLSLFNLSELALCCDNAYVFWAHKGKCDHRNCKITALGLWVIPIKFENCAILEYWTLPGSKAAD